MKRLILFPVFILAILLPGALSAQDAARPTVPSIPWEMHEQERKALMQGALLLSQGRFKQAASLLSPFVLPVVVRVYVDWTSVPKASQAVYRRAAQRAVRAWNTALKGTSTFQWTERKEEASVRLLFAPTIAVLHSGEPQLGCVDCLLNRPPVTIQGRLRRSALLRLALNEPHTRNAHDAASIGRHVAQGLGLYLGLILTRDDGGLMDETIHGPALDPAPSEKELKQVRRIHQVRSLLMQYAQKGVAIHLTKAGLSIEKMEIDAGEVWKGETARYVFKIKNSGDAPLHIDAKPNCGCAVARYDKVILPGREGTIEAEMRTETFRGRVVKTVSVKSDDPAKQSVVLRLVANVVSVVQVLPSEMPTLSLKESGTSEETLEIRLQGAEPVEITRVVCGAPYVTPKTELVADSAGDRRYRLTLTFQEATPTGRSVFPVTLFTSSPREPQAFITVICEKGILAMPTVLYLGIITPTTSLPLSQTTILVKRHGTFRIRKIASNDPNLAVKQETIQDGAQYRLTVTYKGGWSVGPIQSRITVETDDPHQPQVVIPVNASVYGGGARDR